MTAGRFLPPRYDSYSAAIVPAYLIRGEKFDSVFQQGELFGVTEDAARSVTIVDPEDRTGNLAAVITDHMHDLEYRDAELTLETLVGIEWSAVNPLDRATMIDYCSRVLGSVGLGVRELDE